MQPLELEKIEVVNGIAYGDHTGVRNCNVYHGYIRNNSDKLYGDVVCRAKGVQYEGWSGDRMEDCPYWNYDRAPLKWAGEMTAYSKSIFPKDTGHVDLFSVDMTDYTKVYLHSSLDVARSAFIDRPGTYRITYELGCPITGEVFEFHVNLQIPFKQPSVSIYKPLFE